jgi:hypothetical protein
LRAPPNETGPNGQSRCFPRSAKSEEKTGFPDLLNERCNGHRHVRRRQAG